jgi:hypothetical protein
MFESRVCDSEPMLMFQDKTVVLHIHSHVGFGETDIWLRRHDLRSLDVAHFHSCRGMWILVDVSSAAYFQQTGPIYPRPRIRSRCVEVARRLSDDDAVDWSTVPHHHLSHSGTQGKGRRQQEARVNQIIDEALGCNMPAI